MIVRRPRAIAILAALALLPVGLSLAGGEEVILTGWITDSYCGTANASAQGKTCILRCAKDGARLVLFSQDQLYELDDQDLALRNVGHEVRVEGTLNDAGAIEVSRMEPIPKEG